MWKIVIEGLNNYDVLKFLMLLPQGQLPVKLEQYKFPLLTRLYWFVLVLFRHFVILHELSFV